jgi:hypothetical protein
VGFQDIFHIGSAALLHPFRDQRPNSFRIQRAGTESQDAGAFRRELCSFFISVFRPCPGLGAQRKRDGSPFAPASLFFHYFQGSPAPERFFVISLFSKTRKSIENTRFFQGFAHTKSPGCRGCIAGPWLAMFCYVFPYVS